MKDKQNNEEYKNLSFIKNQEDKKAIKEIIAKLNMGEAKSLYGIFIKNIHGLFFKLLLKSAKSLTNNDLIFFNKTYSFLLQEDKSNEGVCKGFIKLGKLLSDDNDFDTNPLLGLESTSYEIALKQRAELLSNKDSLEALNDKFHVQHNNVLTKLNSLNTIIAKAN